MDKMKDFKGTKGEWHADIGADELNQKYIRVIVDSDQGLSPAHAFGKTYDEAMANARVIAQSKNAIEAMRLFCHRVEIGEVRSKKTYAQFKQIIDNALK